MTAVEKSLDKEIVALTKRLEKMSRLTRQLRSELTIMRKDAHTRHRELADAKARIRPLKPDAQ